jgi:hypothetical protein
MGEVPVNKTQPTGTSEDILKINIMMMWSMMMMKNTMRDNIQTFMMNFNDYTFKLYLS